MSQYSVIMGQAVVSKFDIGANQKELMKGERAFN